MRKFAILALLLLGPGLEHAAAHAEEGQLAPAAAVAPAGAAFTPFAIGPPSVAAPLDPALHAPSWLPGDLEVRKGTGLAMSHPVHLGKADLELGVAGPVLRKRNLGLALELRF